VVKKLDSILKNILLLWGSRMQKTLMLWIGKFLLWAMAVLTSAVSIFIFFVVLRFFWEVGYYAWTWGGLV
jgi:hypothetical protein